MRSVHHSIKVGEEMQDVDDVIISIYGLAPDYVVGSLASHL